MSASIDCEGSGVESEWSGNLTDYPATDVMQMSRNNTSIPPPSNSTITAAAQYESLSLKFRCLINHTERNLLADPVSDFAFRTFFASVCTGNDPHMSEEDKEAEKKFHSVVLGSHTVSNLLEMISIHKLWSPLVPTLLAKVIEEFLHDDEQLEQLLQEYCSDLANYLQVTISEHIKNVSSQPVSSLTDDEKNIYIRLLTILELDSENVNMQHIISLGETLSSMLSLKVLILYHLEASMQSVTITWLVPAHSKGPVLHNIPNMGDDDNDNDNDIVQVSLDARIIYSAEITNQPIQSQMVCRNSRKRELSYALGHFIDDEVEKRMYKLEKKTEEEIDSLKKEIRSKNEEIEMLKQAKKQGDEENESKIRELESMNDALKVELETKTRVLTMEREKLKRKDIQGACVQVPKKMQQVDGTLDSIGALALKHIHKKDITLSDQILGQGSFGKVIKVTYKGRVCAAKKFRDDLYGGKFIANYSSEFAFLGRLHHTNIVAYIGYYIHEIGGREDPLLVMECLETNLHNLLDPSEVKDEVSLMRNVKITHSWEIKLLVDIAEGLKYLHKSNPVIIHRDLTAKNVLLDSKNVAKIADFGNSLMIDINKLSECESMTAGRCTPVYQAPEALTKKYNEAVDIFSFGHLMLFVFLHEFPKELHPIRIYDEETGELVETLNEVKRRDKYFSKLHEQIHVDQSMITLSKTCLSDVAQKRPTTECLLEDLKKYLQTLPPDHNVPIPAQCSNNINNSSSDSSDTFSDSIL